MSGARAFFDTNVLLYMYGGEPGKQARAKDLFREHARAGRMLLSTQVVQEFYAAGSRKLGMPRPELRDATAALLDLPLIVVGPPQIMSAIQNEERYQISFWDSLILAAAESGGAEVLYTEDLNDGQQYGSVLVRNPFRSPENS
jgi:predicted nucleic acid-binding protein